MADLTHAPADDVAEVAPADLLGAQQMRAVPDRPWVSLVDSDKYAWALREFPCDGAPVVLSTHLPPARDSEERLWRPWRGRPTRRCSRT